MFLVSGYYASPRDKWQTLVARVVRKTHPMVPFQSF